MIFLSRFSFRRLLPDRRFASVGVLIALLVTPSFAAGSAPTVPSLAGQRVLVLGDSITQDGRYVSFLEYYLHQLAPEAKVDLISVGLSSETLSGLSEVGHPYPRPAVLDRLDRALKAVKPTVVFACYGMNDGIYHPPSTVRLASFNAALQQFVARVHSAGAALVLLTPPVFDPRPIRARTVAADAPQFGYSTPFVDYDQVLAGFATAAVALDAPGVTVIDVHTAMSRALAAARERDPVYSFAHDGVHPGDAGHLLIARTVLQAFGYALPETALNAELARINADPVFALIHDRRRLRSEAWLPFIGYQREATFRSASVDAAETVVARLQREIDATRP